MPVRDATARRLCLGLLAGSLALGACAGPAADRSADRSADPAATDPAATGTTGTFSATGPSATPPVAVPQTLAFAARTVDGQPFDGATLAGRPAVLWFWAAWCTRCRAAADDVAAAARDHAGRVNFVGVAGLGSGAGPMREFVRDRGIGGFPNLADDAGEVWRRFGVTTQEYYVILDPAGRVVHSGALSPAQLRERLAALG